MFRLTATLVGMVLFFLPVKASADCYENYINTVLAKVPKAKGVKKLKKLDRRLLIEYSGALRNTASAFVVIRTNDGRWSKILVNPAEQKLSGGKTIPILIIDQFTTYKDGTDQAIQAQGNDVRLFADFEFNLDIGQVVPKTIGGDIRFVVTKEGSYAEPVGKAEFYLVTKSIPEAKSVASTGPKVGQSFKKVYFTGKYKLYDDGRRNGTLYLNVRKDGLVTGKYYSQKDGRKYEVQGKVSEPTHHIEFSIVYPRITETFSGWMFTANGRAIAGSARMQQGVFGFYAVRIE
ncbi:MAG: hypothetical protein ACFCD0_17135 [Gemmataceae bacterium]